ncbi:MAG TPA: phosphatidate cytidylyltransferase [Chitinophagales bacterium]
MNKFLIRAATGLSLAAIVIFGLLWSEWFYLSLTLVVVGGGLWELYNISGLAHKNDGKFAAKYKYIGLSLALFVQLLSFAMNHRYSYVDISLVFSAILFVFFIVELYSKAENPFDNIAWNLLSLVYILLPVLLLNKMYFDKGKLTVLAVLFLSWFFDSWSYIFGSLLGKHKLFERVSPKKTIEGLIGGFVLTVALAYFYPVILSWLVSVLPSFVIYAPTYTSLQWVFITVIATIAFTYGDLVESLLKRSVGVKDSGSVIPGHGGFLDRLDAIVLGVPFIALTLWLVDQYQAILVVLNFVK